MTFLIEYAAAVYFAAMMCLSLMLGRVFLVEHDNTPVYAHVMQLGAIVFMTFSTTVFTWFPAVEEAKSAILMICRVFNLILVIMMNAAMVGTQHSAFTSILVLFLPWVAWTLRTWFHPSAVRERSETPPMNITVMIDKEEGLMAQGTTVHRNRTNVVEL